MTNFNFKPLFLFLIFILLSLPGNLLGQGPGLVPSVTSNQTPSFSTPPKGKGVFSNKKTVVTDGDTGCEYRADGDFVDLKIHVEFSVLGAPCDSYIGITNENGETAFAPFNIPEFNDPNSSIDYDQDGYFITVSMPVEDDACDNYYYFNMSLYISIYCFDGTDYVEFDICDDEEYYNELWDLDITDETECTAGQYVDFRVCCDDKFNESSEDNTISKRSITQEEFTSRYEIYDIQGNLVHLACCSRYRDVVKEFKQLGVQSGIYILRSKNNNGEYQSTKIFK